MSALEDMIAVIDNDFACGGYSPREIAQEWIDEGFTPNKVVDWLWAGCFTAASARELAEAGITPNQAQLPWRHGMSIGYAVANGQLSIENAITILKKLGTFV